jgi:hypothetical protein
MRWELQDGMRSGTFWSVHLTRRQLFEGSGVEEKTILKQILLTYDMRLWARFM